MLFDTVEDANLRLRDTIIRVGEVPIYVSEIDDCTLWYRTLKKNVQGSIDIDSPRINIEPVPLGYINCRDGMCKYLARIPHRMYKQGLATAAIGVLDKDWGISYLEDVDYSGLSDTIRGKYPAIQQAFNEAQEGCYVAFHREFAINNQDLFYQETKVGSIIVMEDKSEVVLANEYNYLDELIQEEVVC